MRKVIVWLALLGLIGSVSAADLRVGTWKLNIAKSKMPASVQESLKEETLVARVVDGNMEVVSTGTSADGSSFSSRYTFPVQGGMAKYQARDPGQGVSILFTVIDEHTMYITNLFNGKQAAVIQSVFSKDGRSFQNTTRGVDEDGKPFERVTVFEKQ